MKLKTAVQIAYESLVREIFTSHPNSDRKKLLIDARETIENNLEQL